MNLVFFDGHLVWSKEGEVTKIAVLLSDDGEKKAPHLRALARIKLEDADTVFSLNGVEFTLQADHLGVHLVRSIVCFDEIERERAFLDTVDLIRNTLGLRLRRVPEEHIRPIAA